MISTSKLKEEKGSPWHSEAVLTQQGCVILLLDESNLEEY